MSTCCCYCSVAKSCPTLCNPMDCSTPGVPVLHCLSKFVQTHVHWIDDAIQPSHLLLPTSPPALNLSQHQCLSSELALCISGQRIGASASTSVLPVNIQDWFPLGWTGLISLLSKASQESSPTPQFKSIDSSALSPLYSPTLTSILDCWKNHISWTIWTFVGSVMSLLFNTLSRLVIGFLPRSKHLLISWLQSLSTVILEPRKITSPPVTPGTEGRLSQALSSHNILPHH